MTGSATLLFSFEYERRIWMILASLVTMVWGGGWMSGVWKISATSPDGAKFAVGEGGDESSARYLIQAYEGQIAANDHDAAGWARSKGFNELAAHLSHLAGT